MLGGVTSPQSRMDGPVASAQNTASNLLILLAGAARGDGGAASRVASLQQAPEMSGSVPHQFLPAARTFGPMAEARAISSAPSAKLQKLSGPRNATGKLSLHAQGDATLQQRRQRRPPQRPPPDLMEGTDSTEDEPT